MKHAIIDSTLVTVLTIACGWAQATFAQVPAAPPLRSGTYPLQAYNGRRLPTGVSLVPPKVPPGVAPESFEPCLKLVTGGTLTLDIEARRFSLSYDVWSPCDRAYLPKPTLSGRVQQHGSDLMFLVARGDGADTLRGSTSPSTLAIDHHRLEFRMR